MSERAAAPRETKGPARVASGEGGLALRTPASAVPPGVHEVLRSPGQPLDPDARAFMEPRLGFDFSRVRVHSDAEAAASASAVNALAYTFGHHVVFGAGHYVPRSAEGQRLLAHELTHVVQQAGGALPSTLVIGQRDRFELVADRAADAVATGKADLEPLGSGEKPPEIQRQPAGASDFPPPPSPDYTPQLSLSPPGPFTFTIADFALDKADLPEIHLSLLATYAKFILSQLKSDPFATVEVTGHTDAPGSEQHNQALGLQRAEAVKRALVTAGVLASGIATKSAGESQPLVPTQAHDPGNRRVEIRFAPSPQAAPGTGPKAGLPFILPPPLLAGEIPPLSLGDTQKSASRPPTEGGPTSGQVIPTDTPPVSPWRTTPATEPPIKLPPLTRPQFNLPYEWQGALGGPPGPRVSQFKPPGLKDALEKDPSLLSSDYIKWIREHFRGMDDAAVDALPSHQYSKKEKETLKTILRESHSPALTIPFP